MEANDPLKPVTVEIGRPIGADCTAATHSVALAVQEFAAQYATAILLALIVATVFFPGNAFLPVPWLGDDYRNLISHDDFQSGPYVFLHSRPVSDNLIKSLSAAGETAYFLVLFLLTALLPVLAVRLALRLFRCRTGPWLTLWLIAAVSTCSFLYEESPWFYRYTGLMTNLTSVTTGFLAAASFGRFFDGKKSGFVLGCVFFLATAFAKEDVLLFVPLYVTVDWCILRMKDKHLAPLWSVALVDGVIAAVIATLYCWNRWIVPSPFTSNVGEAFKQDRTPSHIFEHSWHYASNSTTLCAVSLALAVAVVLGLLRRGHRVAALSLPLLVLSLVLPYAILVKFQAFYVLNWLSLSVALSLVGIALAWRPFAPGRLSILPWIVPVAIVAAVMILNHPAADRRGHCATYITHNQENCRYVIQQVLCRQTEFARAETLAVQGLDEILSPWCKTNGSYMNRKLGKDILWLVVAKPESYIVKRMAGKTKLGQVEIISAQDLALHPGIPILEFDKNQNLTVHISAK
jgi:hypothetical protein